MPLPGFPDIRLTDELREYAAGPAFAGPLIAQHAAAAGGRAYADRGAVTWGRVRSRREELWCPVTLSTCRPTFPGTRLWRARLRRNGCWHDCDRSHASASR